jgi:hypothetical protein
MIMIPINFTNFHWSLVTVDLNKKRISYFDSMNKEDEGRRVMQLLIELFNDYLQVKESQYTLQNTLTNRSKSTNAEKGEDEITNKLSTSFSSTLNQHLNNEQQQPVNVSFNVNVNLQNLNMNVNFVKPRSRQSFTSENSAEDNDQWKMAFPHTPKQTNGSDCGVFVCKYMDYLSRKEPFSFTPEDMPYFRMLIAVELTQNEILTTMRN